MRASWPLRPYRLIKPKSVASITYRSRDSCRHSSSRTTICCCRSSTRRGGWTSPSSTAVTVRVETTRGTSSCWSVFHRTPAQKPRGLKTRQAVATAVGVRSCRLQPTRAVVSSNADECQPETDADSWHFTTWGIKGSLCVQSASDPASWHCRSSTERT